MIAQGRDIIKTSVDKAIKDVIGTRASNAGRAWETLIETKTELLKEDLVSAKPEKVAEIQGAIKELRQILKAVKRTDAE